MALEHWRGDAEAALLQVAGDYVGIMRLPQ